MAMQRRYARATTSIGAASPRSDAKSPDAEINALSQLDDETMRRRWRRLIGRPLPKGLGRGLTLRILAYYQQVQQSGDLDRACLQVLAESAGALRARLDPAAPERDAGAASRRADTGVGANIIVRPGTLLVREHEGVSHRVMALEDGFAWNGKTYESLSKVAFAITGTRWNGPRFFGLRDRPKAKKEKDPKKPTAADRCASSSNDPRSDTKRLSSLSKPPGGALP
jgi:hypothetical protein